MNIDIATLFPEMLENYLSESVVGRARAKNIFTVTCHNIRDYTQDKHRRVDDTPYSERQGMLMQCEPIYNCYKSVTEGKSKPHVIYMSPQGKTLTQKRAKELSRLDSIFILCGHYEGVCAYRRRASCVGAGGLRCENAGWNAFAGGLL